MAAGLEPGDRIGPYTVVGLLGVGSPGWVYLARTGAGRPMAVRMLYGEQQGIKRAQKVRGPGVVEVIGSGGAASGPWVASAYVPAPSLADLVISCGPLTPDAVRWLAAGIAEGLVTIHQASLVHGDLRPAQIVVASDGPRVTGFGITGAGPDAPLAAPGYLAPEQARGEEPVPASDVYALGALLCFAATGHAPHSGVGEAAIRRSVAAGEPELADVPDEVADLIRSCLARDPEDRPTARELLDGAAGASTAREGAYGAASWLPGAALELIDAYHRRGRLVGDPPTVPLADRLGPAEPVERDEPVDSAADVAEADESADAGTIPDPVEPRPSGEAGSDPKAAAPTPAKSAEPAPEPDGTGAPETAETMQLAKIVQAMVPRIDDSDDRQDPYDLPEPAEVHEGGGASWVLVAALVVIALVGGLLAGVAYERGREDRERGAMGPAGVPTAGSGDPVAAFVASVQVGACVDFAGDGSPTWQPVGPRTLPCEDPAARQRVLARTSAGGGTADCMSTDGRSRWPIVSGQPALCLERIFRPGECVPAEVRDGRQWAFLAALVPCQGAFRRDGQGRLRIDEIHPTPSSTGTTCPGRSPVYYPLPSRGQELCMSTVT
ncbi:serine/threonine protein kinase [Embleya hyalina]|uniref:Serine/threonine-protein kinase AfsK n=1 Tax=Embleya hyalina TaxID=516124 RepID=A0A401Z5P2_9ACTN|nr:serine/threonine-protein kinase [Embleya hyalina]GCE02138.1 serine/threonine-protein kinase AfsK [Embleya hyalina]GCE02659.1 serine/threonine-protein kinase AfsK [Embleya hyalina]